MKNIIIFLIQNYIFSFFLLSFLVSVIVFFSHRYFRNNCPFFKIFLSYFVFFSIGVCFIVNFVFHVFFGKLSASFIGWSPSPFQAEVGFASLGFGIVGLISFWGNLSQKTVAVIGPSVFLQGAAIGHIYQIYFFSNLSPGNAGIILWTDIFVPLIGYLLIYINFREHSKRQKSKG